MTAMNIILLGGISILAGLTACASAWVVLHHRRRMQQIEPLPRFGEVTYIGNAADPVVTLGGGGAAPMTETERVQAWARWVAEQTSR